MAPKTIIFIRHAEKSKTSYPLTAIGKQRSLLMVDWLVKELPETLGADRVSSRYDETGIPIDIVYTPEPQPNGADIRPRQTVMPLSFHYGLPLYGINGYRDIDGASNDLVNTVEWNDAVVLVCWEHKNIKPLVRALMPYYGLFNINVPEWASNDFSTIYILSDKMFEISCENLLENDSDTCSSSFVIRK